MAAPRGVPSSANRRTSERRTATSTAPPSATPCSSTPQMLPCRGHSALELGAVPDAHGGTEVSLGVGVDRAEDAVELTLVQRPHRHLPHQVDGILQTDGEAHGEQVAV